MDGLVICYAYNLLDKFLVVERFLQWVQCLIVWVIAQELRGSRIITYTVKYCTHGKKRSTTYLSTGYAAA